MRGRPLRLMAIAAAFVILTAGDCEIGSLGDLLDEPGTISVTNTGTERAVLAITADDVKSYPLLAGGATATIQTNVGGTYRVAVTMSPENAARYATELTDIRRGLEALIGGTVDAATKTTLFVKLSGIKAAISALEQGGGAQCGGRIQLDKDSKVNVTATVTWIAQDGSGFWELTCGST